MSDNQYESWYAKSGNIAIEDPHQRLLSKLGKLLEVRNRAATEAESATAAAILSRFLDEHNLSMADIEAKGQAAPGVVEGGYDLGKAAFKWKLNLADGIASLYYAAPLVDRNRKTVVFVGRPDNVEALTMLYKWVIDQIKALATEERRKHFDTTGEHIDPLRWQLGFGEGAVSRLIERLKEMKARQQEDMSRNEQGDITALVMHHSKEANDYLEEKYGYRKDGLPTKRDREYEERWRLKQEAKDNLRVQCESSGDMEPYYEVYPWERPKTAEQIEQDAKELEKYLKKEAKKESRRTGPTYRERRVDFEKEAQVGSARTSGKQAADRVNLQPFIGGSKERKKVE